MKKSVIYIVVLLIGAYVVCQAIADVGATKLIQIGSITMPAGSLIFALTFTLRDLLHKKLGKDWARAAILMAALFNILQAAYLAWMARIPAPVFYQNAEAWSAIFSIVPSITIGSIVAEFISESIDTEVYHFWMNKVTKRFQWSRVLISNAVSLPLDSLIFASLAFVILPPLFGAEPLPFAAALALAGGQIVFKALITLASMPLIYLVKDKPIDFTVRSSEKWRTMDDKP